MEVCDELEEMVAEMEDDESYARRTSGRRS